MAAAGDMLQKKIGELFKDLPNAFSKADDISVVGYDADDRDHDKTLKQVMPICQKENLKINAISGYENTIF